jgi:hypothetical protein
MRVRLITTEIVHVIQLYDFPTVHISVWGISVCHIILFHAANIKLNVMLG